jgi:hypothetical protein
MFGMLRDEIQALKTGPRDLRKFGLMVGGVFALLAAWCWWREKAGAPYFLCAALPLVVLGCAWPGALKWPYIAWMSIGLALGLIVSSVLLTVFFYLVVTPFGLLARAAGKDFMRRRKEPGARTYWQRRRPSSRTVAQRYEQQF